MSTKDNPGTLPINPYAQVQPTITPLDFSKIAEDGQDGAKTTAHHVNSHELLYTTGDVVFLASDATSGRTVVYVLEESITASTKKAKARLFEGDPFNLLIFYTEGVVEINVKDIGGSLEETVRGDGNIELTENEFIRYESRMIECVDALKRRGRSVRAWILTKIVQRMRGQNVHHTRERGHIGTIFCLMTTEKVRLGFLVFPKHYLHLLEKS